MYFLVIKTCLIILLCSYEALVRPCSCPALSLINLAFSPAVSILWSHSRSTLTRLLSCSAYALVCSLSLYFDLAPSMLWSCNKTSLTICSDIAHDSCPILNLLKVYSVYVEGTIQASGQLFWNNYDTIAFCFKHKCLALWYANVTNVENNRLIFTTTFLDKRTVQYSPDRWRLWRHPHLRDNCG